MKTVVTEIHFPYSKYFFIDEMFKRYNDKCLVKFGADMGGHTQTQFHRIRMIFIFFLFQFSDICIFNF